MVVGDNKVKIKAREGEIVVRVNLVEKRKRKKKEEEKKEDNVREAKGNEMVWKNVDLGTKTNKFMKLMGIKDAPKKKDKGDETETMNKFNEI